MGGGGEAFDKPLRTEPKPVKEETYRVPEERSAGRPHDLGWFEILNKPNAERVRLGEVPPGKIITED